MGDAPECPDGWRIVTLADVCAPRKAMVDPQAVEELPYVGMEHIESGELAINRWASSSEVKSSKTEFQPADVLYGKLRPYLEKAVLAPWRGLCSTELIALQVKDGVTIPEYLVCLVHTKPFVQHAIDTTGGTNLPRTSWTALKEYRFALPPLPQQRAIAHVLRTVQRAKEATEKVIAAARTLKQSLMRHLFTYGPVPFDQADQVELKETDFGAVPVHWQVVPVGDVCQCIVPGRTKPKRFDGHIPWITMPDLKDRVYVSKAVSGAALSTEAIKEVQARIIPSGSVVMSCVGEFGIAVITHGDLVINQQLHAFICPSQTDNYFLCHALRLQEGYMERIAHFTTIPYLNKAKCNSVPVPLPPVQEQRRVSGFLMALDQTLESEYRKCNALNALFGTLLHNLMTGRVRVHDLDVAESGEATWCAAGRENADEAPPACAGTSTRGPGRIP